jgi:SET domain-containing protein
MKEKEIEKDINVDIKILPYILRNISDNSRKWKTDNPSDCRCKVHVSETIPGEASRDMERDRLAKLKEYYN